MNKRVSFIWHEACQRAFNDLKKYLTKSSVFMAPISGRPFLRYVRDMDHALGALLAPRNEQGHEHIIYYLSCTIMGVEHLYSPIEKECLALVFAIQMMRHYLVG